MTEPAPSWGEESWPDEPDVSHLVTEDDTPVENWFQEKEMHLLTEALDVSWSEGRPFVSGADVGVFYAVREAIVPDVLLSVGVDYPEDYHEKNRGSYFTWVFGKPPDLVIEIVSNRTGGEDTSKLKTYAEIRVPYYVIHDPFHRLSQRSVRIFQLSGTSYVEKVDRTFPELGLGLTLWEGEFDGLHGQWLRWTDRAGCLLETGTEARAREQARADREQARADQAQARVDQAQARADQEQARADQEQARANHEQARADQEAERRMRLEAKLRALGMDPDS
ncbi:MAG: Uma2 family endonuclease [Candidatus Eremiobacterota bacterium]